VPTENVRACLAAVEAGNADAGIVYKTDALISKKVKIAYEVTAVEGPKISYPLAVMKESKNTEAARKFVAYLASPEARAVFTKIRLLAGALARLRYVSRSVANHMVHCRGRGRQHHLNSTRRRRACLAACAA